MEEVRGVWGRGVRGERCVGERGEGCVAVCRKGEGCVEGCIIWQVYKLFQIICFINLFL